MRKPLLTIFLFVLAIFQASAQEWQRLGSWGNELTDIHWINGDVAFVSGEELILKTVDGGTSWSAQKAPSGDRMMSLDFYGSQIGLMVGENGRLFRTSNGGASWQLVDLGISEALLTVDFVTQNTVWLAGENGVVFVSETAGTTWERRDLGLFADVTSLLFNSESTGYMTTSDGEILNTQDAGESWSRQATNLTTPLRDIYFINDTTGFAVGHAGVILKSTNAGNTWNLVPSGVNYNYQKVVFNRADTRFGVVIGEDGVVFYTNNTGLTFSQKTSRSVQDLHGVDFRAATNQVTAVGGAGNLITSTNSGNSWTLTLSGVSGDFLAVDFFSDLRGYLAGTDGRIYSTTNGGQRLVDRSRPLDVDFHDVEFKSAGLGYVVGDQGTVLYTSNSGGAWTALNPNTEMDLYGLWFFDSNRGYIVGEKGFMAKTDDRGVSWTLVDEGSKNYDFSAIAFFEDGVGLTVGTAGNLLRSTGNENWSKVDLGTARNLNGIFIINEASAVIVADGGNAYISHDKGLNWAAMSTGTTEHLKDVAFLDDTSGFMVGQNGVILQTKDQGKTWELLGLGDFQDFESISFGDANTGYAVGEHGLLYQYSCNEPASTGQISGQENICLSQQIYTVAEDVEGLAYEWRVDGGTIIEGQGTARIVVRWESAGRNAVLVKSTNACGDGPTSALEVTVSEEPTQVQEIIGQGVSCLENLANYEVDSIAGMEYIWELSGGVIQSGQGTAHIQVDWNGIGEHEIRVYPKNACAAGPVLAKAISVINAPAQPSIIVGSAQVGLELVEYEVEEVAGVNYQWHTNGGTVISGQGTHKATVSWEKEGDFTLSVTPMNACDEGQVRELAVNVDLITGIADEVSDYQLKIYPNPSEGNIHIEIKGVAKLRSIRVTDLLGRTIREITPDSGIFNVDVRDLPKGLLLVLTETSSGTSVDKVWIK